MHYVMARLQLKFMAGGKAELHNWTFYLLFPGIIALAFYLGIIHKLCWFMICVVFAGLPWLDEVCSKDWLNPTLEDITDLENKQSFRLMLYVGIACDWSLIFYAMNRLNEFSTFELVPLFILLTLLDSTGFIVAHEMFHKENWLDKAVGTLHQIKNLYMHFTIEHIYGHHKRVSTPDDPTSAPKGMTLYEFVPRSIIGSLKSAFHINALFVVCSLMGSAIFFGLVYKWWGPLATAFMFFAGLGSMVLLEVINYIEHYGLRRKRLEDGTYERVNIRHSWNAPHRISNYLFFKLQRHSDHHENALKPYQTLCSYEDSPQLPHGYTVCIILAVFPSTWFDIMDPLVDEYAASDKGVNLKNLAVAEEKVRRFIKKMQYICLGLASVEAVHHIIRYKLAA